MSNARKCDPEQSQVFLLALVGVLLVIKAQASRYYAEMSSVGTDWDAFTSAQIQHFMVGNYTHFPPERHLFMLQTLSDTITAPHHHPPVLRGRRWGSQRPSADPRIFPVSFTHGRMWIWETSNTRLGKTSTLKKLKAALSSSGCALILPRGTSTVSELRSFVLNMDGLKHMPFFFLEPQPRYSSTTCLGQKNVIAFWSSCFFTVITSCRGFLIIVGVSPWLSYVLLWSCSLYLIVRGWKTNMTVYSLPLALHWLSAAFALDYKTRGSWKSRSKRRG